MVILFLSIMIASIFIFAWMYDRSIQEPVIEKDYLDKKISDIKNRIKFQKDKLIRKQYGID